jgi:hypothetical protein
MLFIVLSPFVGALIGLAIHFAERRQFDKTYNAWDSQREGFEFWVNN